jgi:hypothetical protein
MGQSPNQLQPIPQYVLGSLESAFDSVALRREVRDD